ncbi:MAG: hypothetical protein LBS11_01340 [Oscillospiraceae bacterium]|jgi:hypothetical protein|nr:hypothetical protein [Oscillospiraceae bacterium]
MMYIDIAREEDFARIPDFPLDEVTVNLWNDITLRGRWSPIKGNNITFNGKRHTLRGLTAPLFAQSMDSGAVEDDIASEDITVNNLRLYVDITDTDHRYMGGMVRLGRRFKAEDCEVHTNINSREAYAGGVAGMVEDGSEIIRCVSHGEVKCEALCGGITGAALESRVCGSVSHVKVAAAQGRVAGIAGQVNFTAVESCENAADGIVSGDGEFTGGIVGEMLMNSQVMRCTNYAKVAGGEGVGGIAGGSSYPDGVNHITGSTNAGEISGDRIVGGIVGTIGYGLIQVSNNLNGADVSAVNDGAAGILGGITDIGYKPPPMVTVEPGEARVKNNMVCAELIEAGEVARRVSGVEDENVGSLWLYNNQAYAKVIIHDDEVDNKYIIETNADYGPDMPHGASTPVCLRLPAKSYKPCYAAPPPRPWPKKVIVGGKCLPAPPPIPEWFKGIQRGAPIAKYSRKGEQYGYR